MPNQNPPSQSASSTSWLDNAPGGDIPFDQLFTEADSTVSSSPSPQSTETPTTAAPEPAPVVAEPQTPAHPQFQQVRTKTGTVYETYDAVVKGTEEKDTLIQQLRDRYKAVTGQDPLRPAQQEQPQSYLQNPTKFAEDLADAAKKGDASGYQRVLLQQMDEYLSPVKPLFQEFARARAQEQVRTEIKDYDSFRNGTEYQKTLERNPVLSNAIQGAESDFRFSNQLPELYRLAYDSYTRQRLPEILQAAQGNPSAPATPTNQVRTSTPTTLTPAAPVTSQSEQELLKTKEGREEIKRRFEASGAATRDWSTFRGW